MKIFSVESKKGLIIWSLFLGIIFLFLSSLLAFQSAAHCIDGPCGYTVGWPISFGKFYNQQADDPVLSDFADLIPKGDAHSGTTFDGVSLTLLQVPVNSGNVNVNGLNLSSNGYWGVEKYYTLQFLMNLVIWFGITFLILLGYKKYVKFNNNALLVLSIFYSLLSILALVFGQGLFYLRNSFFILVYIISPFISVAILSSKVSSKYQLISSLIFTAPFLAVLIIILPTFFKSMEVSGIIVLLYLVLIYLAPISTHFIRGNKSDSPVVIA